MVSDFRMRKLLISLFDHSGNACRPYRDSGEWEVIQIDIKNGQDILTWDYKTAFMNWRIEQDKRSGALVGSTVPMSYYHVGIIAAVPCTDYALSGARHFKKKDEHGITEFSQMLVARTKEIIGFFSEMSILEFWYIENPMSRIHALNPWMGKPRLKFNPCDYAGYSDTPEADRYNKATWIWGQFNIPDKKRLEPMHKDNPGWKKLGGKSERTKELRSITPMGFSNAFYQFNK